MQAKASQCKQMQASIDYLIDLGSFHVKMTFIATLEPSHPGYGQIYFIDYPFNDLEHITSSTRSGCTEACDKLTECIGVAMPMVSNEYTECWLKSKLENGQEKEDYSMVTYYKSTDTSGNFIWYDWPGNDIGHEPDMQFGECTAYCKANFEDRCNYVVLDLVKGSGCWFKDTVDMQQLVADPNINRQILYSLK